MNDVLVPSYSRLPVAFVRGRGAWLWDAQGKAYLDALSGIAVCSLGHAHPELAETLAHQARTLLHTSNLYEVPLQQALAGRLTRLSGMQRVFFANSGAEANECAIKLARLHGHARGLARPAVVVMDKAFHGRTMAALSATGNAAAQAGFEPLLEGFHRVPYGDLAAVEALSGHGDIAAVLVEPLQGEGGIVLPPVGWLRGLRALCDRQGWLLMCDEVQSGMCRTGRWFASAHENVRPDVMTLAKALGNGVPIGACLVAGAAAGLMGPGSHGSTFGGGPLVAAAACTVVDVMERDRLDGRAADLGRRMLQGFERALAGVAGVREIRGRGLMLGIELERPCGVLVREALEAGLLINVTAGTVVRLLPPLIITGEEAERIVAGVSALIRSFLARDEAA